MRGWWRYGSRGAENPTAFTQNPMKRFQTPTSRSPAAVRRRAENRTLQVRKSILLEYGNRTVYRNTEIKTIYLYRFHSNPIRDISAGKPAGKEWNGERSSMAQHAILRFEKHKGHPAGPLEAHHERKKEQYASNPDIDTSRSKYNFHIVKPEGRYYHFIQSRIEQAGCRTRKDSTRFVDTLITASPEFFKGKSPKEIAAYFQRAADFLIDRVGRENIVSAVVHMDEKTPHLHLTFVPLTKDNRLCAKEIIGNRANLTKWQDDFHAYMVEKYPDLERGESASKTGRKHIPTRLFKQAVKLSKQARAIETVLDSITPLNAGKKKAEAHALLKKWFPQMENFSGQLKKYKVTINDLLAENETLEARAKASEKDKMKGVIERAKLESELHNIQRLVDRIPPEVLAELKRQPNYGKER